MPSLYVCNYIIEVTEANFDDSGELIVFETDYILQTLLFESDSHEDAYIKAVSDQEGFNDANCDGKLDRTSYRCVGIYELDDTQDSIKTIERDVDDMYGYWVDTLDLKGLLNQPKPVAKVKHELAIFNK